MKRTKKFLNSFWLCIILHAIETLRKPIWQEWKNLLFFSLSFFKPLLGENLFYLVICSQYVWLYMMLILNDTTRPPTICLSLFDTMMWGNANLVITGRINRNGWHFVSRSVEDYFFRRLVWMNRKTGQKEWLSKRMIVVSIYWFSFYKDLSLIVFCEPSWW